MAGPYYVDVTTGDNADTGLSEALAFATLEKAADMVGIVSQAEAIVYVKASADYTVQDGANDCVLQVTTAGASTVPIVWQGYSSVIGDGGIVTIDATDTYASAVKTAIAGNVYNIFKNFKFTRGTGVGFDCNTRVDDNIAFKNCSFDNNGTHGLQLDNTSTLINCTSHTNGTTTAHHGIDMDTTCLCIGGVFHTNSGYAINADTGTYISCLGYNNGNTNTFLFNGVGLIMGCTIDCENGAAATAIRQDSTSGTLTAFNNIVYDANTGILCDGSLGERNNGFNNLFNSNGTNTTNFLTPNTDAVGSEVGESGGDVISTQTDSQLFTAGGTDDYTLPTGSDAKAAAFDAKYSVDFWASFEGATNPPTP